MNFRFLRGNGNFPTLEILFSSLGNLFFQAWKSFGNPRNSLIFATFAVDIGTKPLIIIRTL